MEGMNKDYGEKRKVPCRGQIFKGMNDPEVLTHMNDPYEQPQHKPGYYHNPCGGGKYKGKK
jgi:hypothetical protein